VSPHLLPHLHSEIAAVKTLRGPHGCHLLCNHDLTHGSDEEHPLYLASEQPARSSQLASSIVQASEHTLPTLWKSAIATCHFSAGAYIVHGSQLVIPMCEVTSLAQLTISCLIEMPAPRGLIFKVDRVRTRATLTSSTICSISILVSAN